MQLIIEEDDLVDKEDQEINEEYSHLETYNPIDKTIDFRRLRSTMIKNNPRVHLPGDRPPKEEAFMTTRATRRPWTS